MHRLRESTSDAARGAIEAIDLKPPEAIICWDGSPGMGRTAVPHEAACSVDRFSRLGRLLRYLRLSCTELRRSRQSRSAK